jgi:hypothetical protein
MLVKFSKHVVRLILVCLLLLFSLYPAIGEHKNPYEANLNKTQMEADSNNPYIKINHQIQKSMVGSHAITNNNTTTNKCQVMEKNAWVSPEKTMLHLPQWSLLLDP